MVWLCQFFFANRKAIHFRYKELFGIDEQVEQPDNEGVEDTTKMGKKETAVRFYFNLTHQLAGEDITKFQQIDNQPLYLCLNICSMLKERYLKQKEELRKLEKQYK